MSELWAARDKNGDLWGYAKKPVRMVIGECYSKNTCDIYIMDDRFFPDLKFSDGPIRVKLVPVEVE